MEHCVALGIESVEETAEDEGLRQAKPLKDCLCPHDGRGEGVNTRAAKGREYEGSKATQWRWRGSGSRERGKK